MPGNYRGKKAASVLGWVVKEMESRYRLMIKKVLEILMAIIQNINFQCLIVVVVDEMSDLMLVAGKEIENCSKLSQMARAAGIHIIMATQRPVDVITGTIKAFPTKFLFKLRQKSIVELF